MASFEYKGIFIEWIGHASFKLKWNEKVIYIDPFADGDYSEKADYILISHKHYDHCDKDKISMILKDNTKIIASKSCEECLKGINTEKNFIEEWEKYSNDIEVLGVPAYNVDKPFHPSGLGVGFILYLGDIKIYFAGDTDFIPEMKEIGENGINIALIPISGTYVMDEKEAVKSLELLKPEIVIPMHYNYLKGLEKDPNIFKNNVESKLINVKVVIL